MKRVTVSLVALLSLTTSACRDAHSAHAEPEHHAHEDHNNPHDHADESAVTFDESHGLHVPPETAAALGVNTAVVEQHPLVHRIRLTGRVFDPGPPARVTVSLPLAEADDLATHQLTGATLERIDRSTARSNRRAEVIFSLDRPDATHGTFLDFELTAADHAPAIVVSKSAVLDSAAGDFVYLVHDDHFRRTPVRTHAHSSDTVEILAGLSLGDRIVTSAVVNLWLTELRLTKRGGHSH
jgi:Membrane-fusion protein